MADQEYEDAWNHPDMKAWADAALTDMAPKVEDSDVCMHLFDGRHDIKLWAEVGASIFMDKPIIIAALNGTAIPEKLKLVANDIVRITTQELTDGSAAAKFQAAVERVMDGKP